MKPEIEILAFFWRRCRDNGSLRFRLLPKTIQGGEDITLPEMVRRKPRCSVRQMEESNTCHLERQPSLRRLQSGRAERQQQLGRQPQQSPRSGVLAELLSQAKTLARLLMLGGGRIRGLQPPSQHPTDLIDGQLQRQIFFIIYHFHVFRQPNEDSQYIQLGAGNF